MISQNDNPKKSYLSLDKICSSYHTVSALEHAHTRTFEHDKIFWSFKSCYQFKGQIPVMLLRNIDRSTRFCNEIRLIITKFESQVTAAT